MGDHPIFLKRSVQSRQIPSGMGAKVTPQYRSFCLLDGTSSGLLSKVKVLFSRPKGFPMRVYFALLLVPLTLYP